VAKTVWTCGACHHTLQPLRDGYACVNPKCDNYYTPTEPLSQKEKPMPFPMTITEMSEAAYNNSKAKGFWDEHPTGPLHPETIASKLALIHSEVSEALEDARDGNMTSRCDEKGKPIGFGSELADIVIRVGDLAKRLGIDLGEEVTNKMVFNATRPHKHGRKI